MSSAGKVWTATIAGAIVGALLGAGGAYLYTQQQLKTMSARLAMSEARRTDAEKQAAAAQKKAELATRSAAAAPASTSGSATPSAAATSTTTTKKKSTVVRQFAFIKKVTKTGTNKYSITADYAQFLTGKAAATAATAHGDESPPPNDYYIVNDNKLLRVLPVKQGSTVTLNDKADGTIVADGYTASMSQFAALMSGPDADRFKSVGYWLTITDGVVTHIAEQWVP